MSAQAAYSDYSIFDQFNEIERENPILLSDDFKSQAEKWGVLRLLASEYHLDGRDAARFFASMM